MGLSISRWKYGKQWVYSVTYDEALEELHRFAIPYHEELGIPGHAEAVAGHIGKVRQLGQSSYNGFHHMGPDGLKDLIARGWGVGNHTWSHELVTPDMVDLEIGEAKRVLEEACGAPVPLYCAAGNNANMSDHVLAACRKHGYLGAMSITDALNLPEDELFWLNRTALHEQYYEPFYSAYDPYRNIRYAQERGGWIIDYCHCPLERAVHPNKDCSESQLRTRFETVLAEGGDRVWCANPNEVANYHAARRCARIQVLEEAEARHAFRVSLDGLPSGVTCTALTFEVDAPAAWCVEPAVWVDGVRLVPQLARPRVLRFTVDAANGMTVEVRNPSVRQEGEGR